MALAGSVVPQAAAQPACPDVEVVFARGTGEAPGVGGIGQAFVDAVRAQAGARTVGVYAVNYPASGDFDNREAFARTVVDGIRDEGGRIQQMSVDCPNTRMVLGGYSQGAVVTGFATSDVVPSGVPADQVPAPLSTQAADHVAAVVLFGTPSGQFLSKYGAPQITIGSRFADKTLQLCAPGDTICDGDFTGAPSVAHALYGVNGQVNEGAAFAVGKL
ncbi:cutinase family protein [Mycolicibacterium sediminis]|nr:cutinase family protein [Mycolicibacterium sediminis]